MPASSAPSALSVLPSPNSSPATASALSGISTDDLRDALFAAKIASYAQGFALLKEASEAKFYGTDLSEVVRIWTAGCIIRARFLDDVRQAFKSNPGLDLLAFAPDFALELRQREGSWRRVVQAATEAGIPIPGLSASLSWFDTLRWARGSSAMIQAQRDYFGSHTYERIDRPGIPVHTQWGHYT
jgi:6-phosphogluconate dehydrogenase